ncbi:COX15/CtaA family protein [Pelagicoccus sp. SDUM812003]|uniref:COX15/CtaA family protein n=1 Tax=Pelagicoccus sp. SDUM812003 TaxID=3041267 RepID=UPI00280FCC77|nr:COX15/CtaA family protein [Pelagicoccus sp. SDUM812003]MDQ8204549.1 COX15/CtaA family protein [Pelagicoccus sp. SDUM812003]
MPVKADRKTDFDYKPALFWFGLASLVWITFLLYAGGFTTTIRAGMAFLDWPLSNGSINPEGWLENRDMAAEHSHRLLGMVMGLLSIGMCVLAHLSKAAPRVRSMGNWLVGLVIFQGLLGGLRVKLDQLNLDIDHNLYAQSFAVAHATLAQLFLCLLIAFVISNSRSWIERNAGFAQQPRSSLSTWGLLACAAIVLQLIVGAIMRHAHAGLAIPTFPLTPHDTLIPPVFTFEIAIHFAHRVGAVVVTAALVAYCVRIWKEPAARAALLKSSIGLLFLLLIQVALGALVIWKVRNEHVTTLHMLNGAFTLALCWSMTYRSLKSKLDRTSAASDARNPAAKGEATSLGHTVQA